MTAQQIADVLDVDLNRLKENREAMTDFYAAIRKGRAKGEAELRAALFKLARKGDAFALRELLRIIRFIVWDKSTNNSYILAAF